MKEVICGDPECAPVDTVVTMVWEDGGRGMFAFPAAPEEIEDEDILENMPDTDILEAWKRCLQRMHDNRHP